MALPAGSEVVVGGITALVRIDGYEKGIIAGQGPWRKIKYRVAWDDSDAFCDALMGLTTYTGGVGGPITWPIPHAYPGNIYLRCVECMAKPLGGLGPDVAKVVTSVYAEVSATYQALPFDVEGNQTDLAFDGNPRPWIRDERKGYVNTYKIAPGAVEQDAGQENPGQTNQTPQHRQVIQYDYRRTISGIPYLMPDSIINLGGKLNASTFWGKPRGQFYFEPIDETTQIQTDGARANDLVLTLKWRPYDWNDFIDDTLVPNRFIKAGGTSSDTMYEYADFSPINQIGL